MNVSIEAADIVGRLPVRCVGSVVSHFGCEWLIDIVEFVGGYLVNTSFPEEIRMKITINEKQHVLCRPRHRIITMSECPRNVLRVSVSTSTRNAGEKARGAMAGAGYVTRWDTIKKYARSEFIS
jgi:hypothetical protein